MKRYTVNDIMELNVCYSRAQVKKLFGKRKYTNVVRIAAREDLSVLNRVIVLLQLLDERQAYTFACKCVERLFRRLRRKGKKIPAECKEALVLGRKMAKGVFSIEEEIQREALCSTFRSLVSTDVRVIAMNLIDGNIDVVNVSSLMDDMTDSTDVVFEKENRVQLKCLVEILS